MIDSEKWDGVPPHEGEAHVLVDAEGRTFVALWTPTTWDDGGCVGEGAGWVDGVWRPVSGMRRSSAEASELWRYVGPMVSPEQLYRDRVRTWRAAADATREALAQWVDRPRVECQRGRCTCWPDCEAQETNKIDGARVRDQTTPPVPNEGRWEWRE